MSDERRNVSDGRDRQGAPDEQHHLDDAAGFDADHLDRTIDAIVGDGASAGSGVSTRDAVSAPDGVSRPRPGVDRQVGAALSRVRALADDRIPPDTRVLHLARIRTYEPTTARPRAHGRALRWRRRLVPVAAAASGLVLLAASGAVAASRDAGPDDTLYGVKRASERVWVSLPRGAEQGAQVRLVLAERRLEEARTAPEYAERLIAEGVADAEQAADERPREAVETLGRLLGDGEGSLPPNASPRARAALHRNCVRMAEKWGLDDSPCGEAPDDVHPGRGRGLGRGGASQAERAWPPAWGRDGKAGPPGLLEQLPDDLREDPGEDRRERHDRAGGERGPRGWGPGGRPEGVEGPPPHARGRGPEDRVEGRADGDEGPPPHARGWGPGGRPEGWVGPPPNVPPGHAPGARPDRDADTDATD